MKLETTDKEREKSGAKLILINFFLVFLLFIYLYTLA